VRLDPFFFKPPDYRHGLLGCYRFSGRCPFLL
jgi:hypothetical protein